MRLFSISEAKWWEWITWRYSWFRTRMALLA